MSATRAIDRAANPSRRLSNPRERRIVDRVSNFTSAARAGSFFQHFAFSAFRGTGEAVPSLVPCSCGNGLGPRGYGYSDGCGVRHEGRERSKNYDEQSGPDPRNHRVQVGLDDRPPRVLVNPFVHHVKICDQQGMFPGEGGTYSRKAVRLLACCVEAPLRMPGWYVLVSCGYLRAG